jgi:hypothetical protein
VRDRFQRGTREKVAARLVPRLDVTVDLVQDEARQADVDALGLRVELREINFEKTPGTFGTMTP